ncbi:hypothetical protein BDV09DRAFT_182379 [Aspergillus tetrazonus]
MVHPYQIPVVVGVGDIKNPSLTVEDAIEPLDLMVKAIEAALKDTSLSVANSRALQSAIDSISVVANWTWPYPNTAELIAGRLECNATHLCETLDEAARRISLKQSSVAVVTGGEALASLAALKANGKFPPSNWTPLQDTTSILKRPRPQGLGSRYGLGQPTQIYAMYEAGFRAHRGQKLVDNHLESSQLYAEFSEVAAMNPNAWRYGKPADSAQVISTINNRNRIICQPYPLLMNAFNTVLHELGIPEEHWIYPLGGAGIDDHEEFWKRPNFYSSRSLQQSLDAALEVSHLTKEDIDLFDFYSCFPIVPKLASSHLGLPITGGLKPITLLGELTYFGGAGNNYSLHAITEMVRRLRKGQGQHGLVLANGGALSHHYTVTLSKRPRMDGLSYPKENPLPAYVGDENPPLIESARGFGVMETYTVQYARDGSPQIAFIIGRLRDGAHRFIANAANRHIERNL